jgi:hypothetical protein
LAKHRFLDHGGGNSNREGNVRVREEHLHVGEQPAGEESQFLGGVPPGPLVAIAQPRPVGGGGCKGWVPGDEDFVVAEDELLATGECEQDEAQERQPLFVRSLRGGPWRVLRWLPGDSEPMMLAAEGNLVAVGLAFSRTLTSAEMQISTLNVRNGRTQAHFDVPYGHLAFASRDRLVLSVHSSAPVDASHGTMAWRCTAPADGASPGLAPPT